MNYQGFFSSLKKIAISVLVVFLVGVVGFYASQKANDFLSKPIEQLAINGRLHYVELLEVENIVKRSANQSFVKEHLENIRNALLESPWIDDASLTRRWPNKLEVLIQEQKPIARWGDEGFVNFRGELVKTTLLENIQHLPLLYGAEADAATIMKQYKILAPLLLGNELAIESLNKDVLGVWQLQLSNSWQLILGRNGLVEKMQTVNHVLNQNILLVDDEINTIDMRYENGFAIAWNESVKTVLDDQNENEIQAGEPS